MVIINNKDYTKESIIEIAGSIVAGVLGNIILTLYDKFLSKTYNSKFAQDFVAQGNDFNRSKSTTN